MLDVDRGKKNSPNLLLLMGKVCNKSPGQAEDSPQLKLHSSRTEKELPETGVMARGVHKEAVLSSMDSNPEEFPGLCPAFFSNI